MKRFSLYYNILEQTPGDPAKPVANKNNAEVVNKDANGPDTELTTTKAKVETGAAAGNVIDEKLGNLEGGYKDISQIMISKPKLKEFLSSGNDKLEGGKTVEILISDLEALFAKVVLNYCKVSETEAKHMATGIVCSFVDSITFALNTQSNEAKDVKSDKNPGEKDDKFKLLRAFGKVGGNLLGMVGENGQSVDLGGLGNIFANFEQAFGSYEVLQQRLKSVFVMMELVRKAKALFIDPATNTSKEALHWDSWVANDPNKFVSSVRILETAYIGNKDVLKPEYIEKKSDYLQVLKVSDNSFNPPRNAELNLLQLLGLSDGGLKDAGFEVNDYFADLSDGVAPNPKIAGPILQGLQKAIEYGTIAQQSRKKNQETFSPLKQQVDNVMKSFEPLLGDKNNPDSLYSTFRKWVNLVWGFFTGEAFDDPKYDNSNLESNAAANVAAGVDFANMSADGKTLLSQFPSGSVAWHAANVIFVQESALRYNAINAEDNNGLSIGPMQWNDIRCRNIFTKVLSKSGGEEFIKNGVSVDFYEYITGPHKGDRSRDISNWGDWKRNTEGIYTLENQRKGLEPWQNADVMNKLLILLNKPEIKSVMNEQIKSDIVDGESNDEDGNIRSYMNVLGKDILEIANVDDATIEQKKALILCARLYNANPEGTKNVLQQAKKTNNITLNNLKVLFAAQSWIRGNTSDGAYDHNILVDKTIAYCNACIGMQTPTIQTSGSQVQENAGQTAKASVEDVKSKDKPISLELTEFGHYVGDEVVITDTKTLTFGNRNITMDVQNKTISFDNISYSLSLIAGAEFTDSFTVQSIIISKNELLIKYKVGKSVVGFDIGTGSISDKITMQDFVKGVDSLDGKDTYEYALSRGTKLKLKKK